MTDDDAIINNLVLNAKKKETIKIADTRFRSNETGQEFEVQRTSAYNTPGPVELVVADQNKETRLELRNEDFNGEKINYEMLSAFNTGVGEKFSQD